MHRAGPTTNDLGTQTPGVAPGPNTRVHITGVPAPSTASSAVADPARKPSAPPSEYPGIALIVGAGSRLGRAVALSLLRHGCTKFILTDPSTAALNSTSALLKQVAGLTELWTTAFVLTGHYTDADFAQRLIDEIKRYFGRVDYVVNIWSAPPKAASAGVAEGGRFSSLVDEMDLDVAPAGSSGPEEAGSAGEWDTVARGLKGFYELSRKELALMKGQQIRLREEYVGRKQRGSVVHVVPDVSAAVVKALHDTISSLTTSDASTFSEHLIRINAVLTGPMEDPEIPMELRQMMASRGGAAAAAARGLGERLRTVDEVVDTVVWLLGEKSSFVHGQVLGR